jgi:hypothetical protein
MNLAEIRLYQRISARATESLDELAELAELTTTGADHCERSPVVARLRSLFIFCEMRLGSEAQDRHDEMVKQGKEQHR